MWYQIKEIMVTNNRKKIQKVIVCLFLLAISCKDGVDQIKPTRVTDLTHIR